MARMTADPASTGNAGGPAPAGQPGDPGPATLPAPPTTAPIWPGRPYPLGASFDGSGTNFALFSEIADRVELCLFDADGTETREDLPETTGYIWHGYAPTVTPGQRYGFRVHGPWDPANGLRCNAAKLLLDPYAKAVEGTVDWNEALYPYRFGAPGLPR